MDNVIHLLSDAVANQIAAGEVIQRPASVIKELVENSIDAGATSVKVVVKDAGKTLIQVVDNGCGMNETDARLAFERHATSKITDVTDIYKLHTMGFRGEALASIAAVAQVELQTRREDMELGVKIEIAGSKVVLQEPVVTAQGSQFNVKNLFFNIPARRAFMKSDNAEMKHVVQEFLRVALAHPNVALSLTNNVTSLYNLPQGNMKQRVSAVVGKALAQELLPIEVETSIVTIRGFVGTPETARKTNNDQYFFANDRYMRSPYFHKAVMDAYKNIIAADLSPAYFIYMTVDTRGIDVNVHPQKTEIKFEEESAIWQTLNASVRECLGKYNIMPSLDFDEANPIDMPTYIPGQGFDLSTMPTFDPNMGTTYNPFEHESGEEHDGAVESRMNRIGSSEMSAMGGEQSYTSRMGGGNSGGSYGTYKPKASVDGWETLYSRMSGGSEMVQPREKDVAELLLFDIDQVESIAETGQLFQYRSRYIVMPVKNGMMFIDQHRAHERVQYDTISKITANANNHSQTLLFPEEMKVSSEDACIVEEMSVELSKIGMEIAYDAEAGVLKIYAIPSQLDASDVTGFVESMIYDMSNGEADISGNIMDFVLRSLASKSAMPYGKVLNAEEMASLVCRLFASNSPSVGPDGKKILTVIDNNEIDSRF